MSDGLWNAQGASENIIQPFSRHRILVVELSNGAVTNTGNVVVASYRAAESPNSIPTPAIGGSNPDGGPHYVMSPETPDEAKTLGLEWALLSTGAATGALMASALAGGFTVTVWCLVANSQTPDGLTRPVWVSMLPETGVALNELYHSFDINVHAIRFQIANGTSADGANTGAIILAMCEL